MRKETKRKRTEKRKWDDPTYAKYSLFLGFGILIILIFFKKLKLALPIFGEELHILGVSWDVFIRRNAFWLILSGVFILHGVIQLISISNRRKEMEKRKQQKL
jgi:hypothetical protein